MRVELAIKGEVITARFGILALRKYAEHYGLSMMQTTESLKDKGYFGIADLLYFAWLADCDLNGLKPELNLSALLGQEVDPLTVTTETYLATFTLLLEELTEGQVIAISDAIHDTKLFGQKLLEENQDSKKKMTKSQ